MKQLIKEGKFAEAMEIADSIDWRRVKNTKILCIVSDIYKINHKFEESKEILLLAYEKNQTSRLIVYSLCELCIKMDEVVEANEYLKEFIRLAPKDNGRYILRYKMLEAQDVSLEERISVLEEYKNREPLSEKWAYELAYLYHRVGLVTRCIEECDQLFLWFREGKYVLKALELKQIHTPLTAEQQYVYDQQFYHTHRTHIPKTAYDGYDENGNELPKEENIEVPAMDVSEYNTINLQRELAESMKEILPAEEDNSPSDMREVLFSDTSTEEPPIFEEPLDISKTEEVLLPDEFVVEESDQAVLEEVTEETSDASDEMEEIAPEDISTSDAIDQSTKIYKPITDEVIMQATRQNFKPKMEELRESMTAKLPVEMAKMLSQEYDGQISLVVPETEQVEKQITGQLNIIDVMAEWEKIKKATEEKRAEEVRQHVLEQTGNIFVEFDEVSNSQDILASVDMTEDETDILMEGELPLEDEPVIQEAIVAEIQEDIIEEVAEEIEENSEESLVDETLETLETLETEEIQFEVAEEESVETPEDIIEEDIVDEDIVEEEEVFDEEIFEEETFEEEDLDEVDTDEEVAVETEEEADDVEDDAEELGDEVSEEESEETSEQTESVDAIRPFTPEEKMLFHSFVQTKKEKKKLITAIDGMSLAAYTGNVIITGEESEDTTTLAKSMIKDMQISDPNFSGKIAKITGKGLENKDIKDVLDKLENGALIIEGADKMSKDTVDKLYKGLEREDKGIVVIMEGPKKAMNKFLDKHNILNKVFTARFDIEGLSNKALVEYAKRYAYEKEYSLDELAVLALHSRIDDMQTNDHSVTIEEVREIVDEAIANANRKNLKHFFDVLCSNRYDEEDMIILRERDFEIEY